MISPNRAIIIFFTFQMIYFSGIAELYASAIPKRDILGDPIGSNRYTMQAQAMQKPILGSTRDEILERFKAWKRSLRYETQVQRNALKFENPDLIVVVLFDNREMAEGVAFLSQDVSDPTGKTSYVNKNYEMLIKLATGGGKMKVENNKGTAYPNEIYIGNVP